MNFTFHGAVGIVCYRHFLMLVLQWTYHERFQNSNRSDLTFPVDKLPATPDPWKSKHDKTLTTYFKCDLKYDQEFVLMIARKKHTRTI